MGESLNLSPLGYAYLGDAVYEQYVRLHLVSSMGNAPVEKYHKQSIGLVSAGAQSKAVTALMEELSEEEQDIYKRGRNSKPHTMPKNGSPADYHRATGFEAVIGWLYINGKTERAEELMEKAVRVLEAGKKNGGK